MLFVFATSFFDHFQAIGRVREGKVRRLALACLLALSIQPLAAADLIDLRPPTQPGGCRSVKIVVEVGGKLKLNPDGQEVQHLPLKVAAELAYLERVVGQSRQWHSVKLLRSYQSATAKITLRQAELTNTLREGRRLIAVEPAGQQAVLFSPAGPLTREELELLQTPGSGLALEALLPPRILKLGGHWQIADDAAGKLLGLDVVNQQNITATLDSAKDGVAVVSLVGKVAGSVGGVSSDIDLKGKLNFNLQQRAVTWLTLAFQENRAIGHAQPGFEALTTLKLVSAPIRPAAELADQALAGLSLAAGSGQTLLELTNEAARFQLLHDRRWQVMLERQDATILRLVDRGDLIAQCNVSPRPPLGKGEQLTLEGFQDDVKRALGKNFEQVVAGAEEVTDGIRVLRVVVAGKVGDLPIQWTYYHLSNDPGQRAALVFTIEAGLVEKYPQIDHELISGFRFLPERQPTPALNGPRAAQTPPAEAKLDR